MTAKTNKKTASQKERILGLIADGWSNMQIALVTGSTPMKVESYRTKE